jgi:lipoprotein NlpI
MPSAWLLLAALSLQSPNTLYDRAWTAFEKGDVRESVRLFDQLVQLAPGSEPDLWQRGIAQYEAGQFKACKAQFELHRQVNPNDVENAAFHFLCTAGAEGPEAARKQLLPVGPDARVPMREVYLLFAGRAKPEAVIQAAGARADAVFFANLYLGYYFEAMRDAKQARAYFQKAASPEFAAAGGLMHTVARVHLQNLKAPR